MSENIKVVSKYGRQNKSGDVEKAMNGSFSAHLRTYAPHPDCAGLSGAAGQTQAENWREAPPVAIGYSRKPRRTPYMVSKLKTAAGSAALFAVEEAGAGRLTTGTQSLE